MHLTTVVRRNARCWMALSAFRPCLTAGAVRFHGMNGGRTDFFYAVMPDSLATVDELEASYAALHLMYSESSEHELCNPSYLGQQLTWFWRRSDNQRPFEKTFGVKGVIETQEAAIDPRHLSTRLEQYVRSHPLINLRCGVRVDGAERRRGGFRIYLEESGVASFSRRRSDCKLYLE